MAISLTQQRALIERLLSKQILLRIRQPAIERGRAVQLEKGKDDGGKGGGEERTADTVCVQFLCGHQLALIFSERENINLEPRSQT